MSTKYTKWCDIRNHQIAIDFPRYSYLPDAYPKATNHIRSASNVPKDRQYSGVYTTKWQCLSIIKSSHISCKQQHSRLIEIPHFSCFTFFSNLSPELVDTTDLAAPVTFSFRASLVATIRLLPMRKLSRPCEAKFAIGVSSSARWTVEITSGLCWETVVSKEEGGGATVVEDPTAVFPSVA